VQHDKSETFLAWVPEFGVYMCLVFPYNVFVLIWCTHSSIELYVCFFVMRHASFSVSKTHLFIIVVSCGELSCWIPPNANICFKGFKAFDGLKYLEMNSLSVVEQEFMFSYECKIH
jgi:hypothetical protein